MANLTVSSAIDTFMQSADAPTALTSLGVARMRLDANSTNITSNVTPALVSGLSWNVGAGEQWSFQGSLRFHGASEDPGFRWLVRSAAATSNGLQFSYTINPTPAMLPASGGDALTLGTANLTNSNLQALEQDMSGLGSDLAVFVSGSFKANTATTVGLYFSQINSSADAIFIYASSFIVATRI